MGFAGCRCRWQMQAARKYRRHTVCGPSECRPANGNRGKAGGGWRLVRDPLGQSHENVPIFMRLARSMIPRLRTTITDPVREKSRYLSLCRPKQNLRISLRGREPRKSGRDGRDDGNGDGRSGSHRHRYAAAMSCPVSYSSSRPSPSSRIRRLRSYDFRHDQNPESYTPAFVPRFVFISDVVFVSQTRGVHIQMFCEHVRRCVYIQCRG